MDTENLFYRVISGYSIYYIDNSIYRVYSPTLKLKQEAHRLYLSIIDENKFDTKSWISKETIDNLLKIYNIWDNNKQVEYDKLIKSLDNAKIELYLKYSDHKNRNRIKKLIEDINSNLNILNNKKHYFDYLTLDYYSTSLKNQFLIMNCVYNDKNEKIFGDDLDKIDTRLLENILREIYENNISYEDIKNLARSDIWRSYWDASKNSVFEGKTTDWTDDQRALVNYSKTLDSVREHTECPNDDIFNDSDALDGWILYQKDKIEKEKKKQKIMDRVGGDNKSKNYSNSPNKDMINETFIITDSQEEAQEIFDLNDNTTKHDILATYKLIDQRGSIPWSEAKHFKRHIDSKRNQLVKDVRNKQ